MLPGVVVIGTVAVLYVGAVLIAVRPRTWHAKGERRSEHLGHRD